MTEEKARRFDIKLWIGGHDATDYINPYLKELTYTDSADGEADDLQFTLHDRDGHWCNDWQPTKGTKVKCTAVCKDWEEPGKDIKLLCGEFTIDEVEFSGPPTQVRIKALTSAMTTGLRDSRKSRAWQNSSFQNVAGQIAKEHNLELQYDGDPCSFERKDQRSDSDLGFLNRQCRENGFNCKVHDGKLVIRDARKAEMQKPVLTIPMKGTMYSPTSWSFKTSSADTGYTEAKSVYTDPKKGETHTAVVEAERSGDQYEEADKSITLDGRTESPADAARKAKAKLQDKNGKENTCTIDIMGCPSLYAGQVISLTGYGTFSGTYLVKKATNKFSSSGYTTSAELSKCRGKEDKVLVAKSVEVTSRKKTSTSSEVQGVGKSFPLEYAEKIFSKVKKTLESENELSEEEKTILCLPEITERLSNNADNYSEALGYAYLHEMFVRWLSRRGSTDWKEADPVWVDWEWALSHPVARDEYSHFTNLIVPAIGTHIFNYDAKMSLAKIVLRETESDDYYATPVPFDFINSNYSQWEKLYYTHRVVHTERAPDTGLYYALGDFSFRALASGEIVRIKNMHFKVTIKRVAVYVYDVFNFEDGGFFDSGEMSLGYWSCKDNDFTFYKRNNSYESLKNEIFRSFRKHHDCGHDFQVLSAPHIVEFAGEKQYEIHI